MVAGDGENDLPLFEITNMGARGVVVSNACQRLKLWKEKEVCVGGCVCVGGGDTLMYANVYILYIHARAMHIFTSTRTQTHTHANSHNASICIHSRTYALTRIHAGQVERGDC